MFNKKRVLLVFNKTRAYPNVVSHLTDYYDVIGYLSLETQVNDKLAEDGLEIFTSSNIHNVDFDYALVCSGQLDLEELNTKIKQLGVPEQKIDFSYLTYMEIARDNFLDKYADECKKIIFKGFVLNAVYTKAHLPKELTNTFSIEIYIYLIILMIYPIRICWI